MTSWIGLHSAAIGDGSTLLEQAETVARAITPTDAKKVEALARQLEADLADVPRGFAHGDFFHGNLLVEGERLVGVVDWDAAGPGRLPLVDLLHLRHATHAVAEVDWGPMIVRKLVPWARSNGDELVHDYCRRLGFSVDERRLAALVFAYWLDRVACQLRTHRHRLTDRRWLGRNVALVLRAASRPAIRVGDVAP